MEPRTSNQASTGQGRPSGSNVVAAIVTMDPDDAVLRHVEALLAQTALVLVVDNGSGPGASSLLDDLAARERVRVVRNPANRGIATALNQAAREASEAGATWLLTLDQDADPSPDIVGVAGNTYDAYPDRDRLAVIGSSSTSDVAPKRGSGVTPARPWIDCSVTITAGSFVSLVAFGDLGGFLGDFFVDYVDIEYCLRARARGYRIVRSRTPAMTHVVGRPTVRRLGPRSVRPTNHSAVRRYYITRNRVLVWRRYIRTDSRYVVTDVLASQKELIKLLLFEEDRPAKIREVLSGLGDGIRGITGEKGKPRP